MSNKKKPFYKKWWFIAAVVLFIIGAIGSGLDGESNNAAEPNKIEVAAPKLDEETDPKKEEAKPAAIEDEVVGIIHNKLGEKSSFKKDRIVESKVFLSEGVPDGTKNIILALNADESATNNMTKKKMWIDSIKIIEPLSELQGVENISIEWMYPFTDQYGNEEDSRIMLLHLDKDTLDKIKWDNFDKENLQNVAGEYFEHPALSK